MIEQASLVIGEGNWAVKSDSLLGYKINNGKYYPREMSVVRATTGTRINEDGLVEVVPYNLISYSEQFDNAYWFQLRATRTPNTTTAPDGTLTADSLMETTATHPDHYIYGYNLSFTGSHTYSVYLKQNGRRYVQLATVTAQGVFRPVFDLQDGIYIGNQGANTGATTSMENVGNGWYRCIVILPSNTTNFTQLTIILQDSATYQSYTGDPTKGAYIWGAQVVEGTSALDYLPTTDRLDVARIDYSSGSAALLVEPQRTNLLTYSSSFDNAAWSKVGGVTVTANTTISPSGVQDADTINFSASSQELTQFISPIVALSGTYTHSFWIKGTAGQKVNYYDGTGDTLITLTSEWERVVITKTYASQYLVMNFNSYGGWTATSPVYIWGAQLEAGSYPTSLIPTQGSTVTRNADVISKTGIADLIGQTEGTLYVDVDFTHTNKGSNEYLAQIWVNSSSRILLYRSNVNGGIGAIIIQASSTIYSFVSTVNTNERHKIAFAYKSGDIAFYIDGSSVSTSSSSFSAFSAMANYDLGIHTATGSPLEIGDYSYNTAYLFKTRLTNAELATLTTI